MTLILLICAGIICCIFLSAFFSSSEIFFSSVNLTCAVIYVPKAQKEKAENVLRTLGFTRPLNPTSRTPAEKIKRLAQKDKELSEKIDKTVEDINKYVKYRQAISDTKDYFVLRSDKYKVISELDQSSHTFILYGYIPECDCDKLEELCLRAADCIVEFSEAGDDADEAGPFPGGRRRRNKVGSEKAGPFRPGQGQRD